ncbi:hypothetical protein [Allobranchiibius sp. GilTou73]|uniref:hypothetical protein n=1 Tax=Allobranchiibius sp. GilTou73 TaxID=2904523 RepID=UPI001F22AA6A|nr:hypothetical protein [Allobranchiibius sp. GilTou73]UIJ35724.1 hypothetical protein LVQ62_04890 [Allobranchiibius sp. GilTou73]
MSDQTTSSHDTTPAAAHQQPDTALQVEDHGDTGVFDAFHPPTDAMISDCVHCGFCLPACPTYTLWGRRWTPRAVAST